MCARTPLTCANCLDIDRSLVTVQNIISYFDLTEQEEQVIMKGYTVERGTPTGRVY